MAGNISKIDTFYASSQLCSVWYQNPDTKDLSMRTWICPKCAEHDRISMPLENILTEGLRQIA